MHREIITRCFIRGIYSKVHELACLKSSDKTFCKSLGWKYFYEAKICYVNVILKNLLWCHLCMSALCCAGTAVWWLRCIICVGSILLCTFVEGNIILQAVVCVDWISVHAALVLQKLFPALRLNPHYGGYSSVTVTHSDSAHLASLCFCLAQSRCQVFGNCWRQVAKVVR